MADLDDLPIPSITDMSTDEAIDHLRQMRLARRQPHIPSTKSIKKKESKAMPKMSADQAANLLKFMEEL